MIPILVSFGVSLTRWLQVRVSSATWALHLVVADPVTQTTTVSWLQDNVWTVRSGTYSPEAFAFTTWGWPRRDGGLTVGWTGTLGEGRVYNYPLPTAEVDALVAEMRDKWAL